ncbi:MAG TPA: hypothetical protein VK154_03440 [Chitinophagales bacterium]|nr:hypothetical protein [Chitinophagales bacterium]
MKGPLHLILFVALLVANTTLFAQSPSKFNYQAVARNAAGNALANQNVAVRFTIHHLTAGGTTLYQETHNLTTNAQGLFTTAVGSGTTVGVQLLEDIDWNDGDMYLQVELDAAGGTNYTDMGTTQLISVPYAKHADKANSITLYPAAGGLSDKPVLTHSQANPTTGIMYRGFSDEIVFRYNGWPLTTINLKDSITTIDGKLKIMGSTPGYGKHLVSDASGFATWQKLSPSFVTGVNFSSVDVTSSGADLGTGTITYTKLQSGTDLEIDLNTRINSGTFAGGATNIQFVIKVDGIQLSDQNMFYIFSTNTTSFVTIKAIARGLSAGAHTITVQGKTNTGTSTGVSTDPGGYGGRIFIKETW